MEQSSDPKSLRYLETLHPKRQNFASQPIFITEPLDLLLSGTARVRMVASAPPPYPFLTPLVHYRRIVWFEGLGTTDLTPLAQISFMGSKLVDECAKLLTEGTTDLGLGRKLM